MMTCFSSVAAACCTAATDCGRPTASGIIKCGYKTMLLIGTSGNVRGGLAGGVLLLSLLIRCLDSDQEHAVCDLRVDTRISQITRQLDTAFKAAVSDFHGVVAARFAADQIAAHTRERHRSAG